jgi:hypothetical protein
MKREKKEVVIWLRGLADEINTYNLRNFNIKLIDANGNEQVVDFSIRNLESLKHSANGYLQLVFYKGNIIESMAYPIAVEVSEEFYATFSNIVIEKLYIRAGYSGWIRVVDAPNHKREKIASETVKKLTSLASLLDELISVYDDLEDALDVSTLLYSIKNFKQLYDDAIKYLK